MNRIASITLKHSEIEALSAALFNAGQIVGRREVQRTNVFLINDKNEKRVVTTFDNYAPGLWGLLIGVARWSDAKEEFVISTNNFLDAEYPGQGWVVENLEAGIASGTKAYDEVVSTNEVLEALDKAAVVRFDSEYGTTAYFQDRETAEEWSKSNAAEHHPWTVVFVSFENDALVHAIVGAWKDEGGPSLDGLWKAFVSKKLVSEEV